ncbi:MAG: DUF433 domain-containing protein [Planctomycetes bacterium]|nr:DUF433 domain-containing protein [Planctomycetota bacterium]
MEDPREIPAYSLPLAAHYLRLPVSTLRDWVKGGEYPTTAGQKHFCPLINLPNPEVLMLSFYNLAEAHVLSALRRTHHVKMPAIRAALDFVSQEYGWKRPLIQQEFKVGGASVFVENLQDKELVDAGTKGRQRILGFIREYLTRLKWENKVAVALYPFTRLITDESPKSVVIDPRYSFGRPVLAKIHVPTAIIAERYKAGETTIHLAKDYACKTDDIEEAVRCELNVALAA